MSHEMHAVDRLSGRVAALEKRLEDLERHTYRRIARETVDRIEPPRPFTIEKDIRVVGGVVAVLAALAVIGSRWLFS